MHLQEVHEKKAALDREFRRIPPGLASIDTAQPGNLCETSLKYLQFFKLNSDKSRHTFGSLSSRGYCIFVHLVQPEDQAKGTVILCHGYLDHSALYAPFTHFLLEQGYAVVLWDLPGHGLSSGEPADIDSFHSYGRIFADILGLAGERMPAPYSAVGHSTGASTIMEYMQRHGNGASRLEAGILVAPLVRSYAWHISQLSKRVAGFFIDRVYRVQRRITHDPDFQRFLKHVAPLTCSAVPFCWINALKKWDEEVEQWPVNNADVLVVQGTKDSVVSWKYNLEFLKRKFPNSTIKRIPGAFHHLLNESAEYREPVYQLIARELSEPPHRPLNERF